MTSVAGWTAIADPPSSRSSVASKRFPLPYGAVGAISLCADYFAQCDRWDRLVPNEFAEPTTVSARARVNDADDQSADRKSAHGAEVAQEGAGVAAIAAEARRLYARLHHDAEEAELGAAQGGQG